MSDPVEPGVVALCACHHPEILTIGDQETAVEVKGHISALIGEPSLDGEDGMIPLTIVGYSATGEIEGGGTMKLDFDFDTGADEKSSLAGRGEESGAEAGRYPQGALGAGVHEFEVPGDVEAAGFAIAVDGERRTARMPLSA